MATKRIDELTALSANVAVGDLLEITDISDTTDRAEGTSKKVTRAELVPAASTTVPGIAELATTAEVDTGTDATRTITPDSLNGSAPTITGTNITGIPAAGVASASSTASGVAKAYSLYLTGNQPGDSTATTFLGPSPVAGTVTDVAIVTTTTTSSDASNYWTIDIQNKDNSNASLLAAAYDTNTDGDITGGSETDLGALNGTGANLVLALGDVIQAVWTETLVATDMVTTSPFWVRIAITPS